MFLVESGGERFLKISRHLAKLLARMGHFVTHRQLVIALPAVLYYICFTDAHSKYRHWE